MWQEVIERATCAKGLTSEDIRPSSGTEKRSRDESAKSRASSWRGKIGGARRDLVLNQVGWIKVWGFVIRIIEGWLNQIFILKDS